MNDRVMRRLSEMRDRELSRIANNVDGDYAAAVLSRLAIIDEISAILNEAGDGKARREKPKKKASDAIHELVRLFAKFPRSHKQPWSQFVYLEGGYAVTFDMGAYFSYRFPGHARGAIEYADLQACRHGNVAAESGPGCLTLDSGVVIPLDVAKLDDVPIWPEVTPAWRGLMSAADVSAMCGIANIASKDCSRCEQLGCLYMEICEDGTMSVTATDGYRLAHMELQNTASIRGTPVTCLLPARYAALIAALGCEGLIVEIGEATNCAYIPSRFARFTTPSGEAELCVQGVAGSYPDYYSVLPSPDDAPWHGDVLLSQVRSVSPPVSRGHETTRVSVHAQDASLRLTTESGYSARLDNLPNAAGMADTVLDWYAARELIQTAPTDSVTLSIFKPDQPTMMTAANWIAVQMPMRY